MDTENYKKALNSQKLAAEINANSKNKEKRSSIIEEFATSKPELIGELHNRLRDKNRVAEIAAIIENIDTKKSIGLLLQDIDRKNKRTRIVRILKATSSIAAAILVISFVIWQSSSEEHVTSEVKNEIVYTTPLNPVLKLSSGKTYELVAAADKAIREDVNYIVEQNSKISNSDLQKKLLSDSTAKSEEPLYLELSVPKKSSYTVVLSDGSEVILNANSSISYPEKFAADKREVEIKGEVFFKVKKSKIPFIVYTTNSYVKVYGTSFNVNARDVKIVKTTLVTGSVGVGAKGITEQMLKPNQMAVVNSNLKECQIKDVNANNSLGWVNGSIICLDNNLESLLNDLKAWYGVDIRYDNRNEAIKNSKINILIKHTMEIDAALKLIEKVTDVKFINEGGYYSIETGK